MKIVIPSKGRADIIGDKALRLFPDATLCVGDDEVDAYARLSSEPAGPPARTWSASARCGSGCWTTWTIRAW